MAGESRGAPGDPGREPGRAAAAHVIDLDLDLAVGPLRLRARMSSRARRVAVVGPSGAGKSLLLRSIAGVEERARGVVRVEDRTWLDTAAGIRVEPWDRGVGWAPQEGLLFPHLGVRENLSYAGATDSEVDEVARLLAVETLLDRRPRNLSGGELRRVGLGRALLAARTLLLLDEPFAALDPSLRAEVAGRVREWAEGRGLPLVLVSHDEEDVAAVARERWLLTAGRLRRL